MGTATLWSVHNNNWWKNVPQKLSLWFPSSKRDLQKFEISVFILCDLYHIYILMNLYWMDFNHIDKGKE